MSCTVYTLIDLGLSGCNPIYGTLVATVSPVSKSVSPYIFQYTPLWSVIYGYAKAVCPASSLSYNESSDAAIISNLYFL